MSEHSSSYGGGGIGFVGLLALVFITLKLCGVIKWSWLWVLAPLWVIIPLAVLVILIALVIAVTGERKRRSR